MMDDVTADPAGHALWGGNSKGLWKMVPLEKVTAGIVRGIERRADRVVVPRSLTLTANAPGLFRPILERVGFRPQTVQRALGLASASGWHDSAVHERHQAGSR
jgi:hypothetical protein